MAPLNNNREGRNQWPAVTPERLSEAKQLLDDGAPISEAVKTTGLARETIRKYLPGYGWDNRQAGQLSALTKQARQAGLL